MMVNPHKFSPQNIYGHLQGGKCEENRTLDYVEILAFAIVVWALGDAIYGQKECENFHTCFIMFKIRNSSLVVGEFSPYRIPRKMMPTYRDRSNGMSMGATGETSESVIAISASQR
jgi:hypothetical protein